MGALSPSLYKMSVLGLLETPSRRNQELHLDCRRPYAFHADYIDYKTAATEELPIIAKTLAHSTTTELAS